MAHPIQTGDHFGVRVLLALALALVSGTGIALAGTHRVERGETLEHVAKLYGCSVDSLLRANQLKTTLVPAGTVVAIPRCNVSTHARTRSRSTRSDDAELDDRAQQALSVIDGTSVIKTGRAESLGEPWNGQLRNGERLPHRDGYQIRRPNRAYAASHVVIHLQQTIAVVRALYPDLHTLAIGDLSARSGGKLGDHQSHQSGLDVDVGFYFRSVPRGYPDAFAPASADLDVGAMWALIVAFVRTAELDTGIDVIFLDYDVQARLYRFARSKGTPEEDLAAILQYPRGRSATTGLIRHWTNHADHLHVRFKPGR